MSDASPPPAADAPYEAQLVMPARRGSFTTVGSFSLLLAVAGLLGLCFSGGLVVSNLNNVAPTAPAADANAMQRFEYALQVEWQGVTKRYLPALAGFFFWHFLAVVLLFIGGIRVMRRTEGGRRFMLYVLLFVLLFEVLRSGLYLLMMLEMMPLVDQILVRELRDIGPRNAQMVPILKRMAQGVTILGILVALVWPALKIFFYGWSARYLASCEAVELCQAK